MQADAQPQQWHTAQWGVLGWVETILKLIGFGAGVVAFFVSLSAHGFSLRSNPHLAAIIVLMLATLFSLVMVVLRFQQKEIISMIFAVLQALASLGLLFALLRIVDVKGLALVFGVCFTLGQIVKLQFLRTTGYTELGMTRDAIIRSCIGMIVGSLLFVVLLLI
jgi:hypothetical protein